MPEPIRLTAVTPASRRWQRKKSLLMKSTAVLLLVVFITVSLHGNWRVALLLLCVGAGLWWVKNLWRRYNDREETLVDVDAMSTEEFVRYVRELLLAQGYSVLTIGKKQGPPADLLLSLGKEHIACWVQHSGRSTDVEIVEQAIAATRIPGDWRAMVVSSRPCTLNARARARRDGCVLIHRGGLANMVTQHRKGHKVIAFSFEEKANLRGRK